MKILYLAAGNAYLPLPNVIYNDLIIKRDLFCDMLSVDLSDYDFIIATPPCNYWSRANCNIYSEYSQKTKNLLPDIIYKLLDSGKPFIVENVINKKRMYFLDDVKSRLFYIEHGRHSYFCSHNIDFSSVPQIQNFKYGGKYISKNDDRQGGSNVNNVILFYLFSYLLNKK